MDGLIVSIRDYVKEPWLVSYCAVAQKSIFNMEPDAKHKPMNDVAWLSHNASEISSFSAFDAKHDGMNES